MTIRTNLERSNIKFGVLTMILQLIQKSSIYRWLWDSPTDPPLSSNAAAKWVGALAAVGSSIGLLVTISLGTPSSYIIDYVTNFIFLIAGIIIVIRSEQITRMGTNAALACGTLVVSLEIATGYGKDPSLLGVLFYVWIALLAFSFFSTIEALCHVLFIILLYSLSLLFGDKPSAPLSDWILTISTLLVTSVSAGYLNYSIRKLSITDAMTGILNRKGWDFATNREVARVHRSEEILMVGLIDLNDFKKINDTLGHDEGDRILTRTATAITSSIRAVDLAARWGGDEFAILAIVDSKQQAQQIVERIVGEVSQVTNLRCGAAISNGRQSISKMVEIADQALYRAKLEKDQSWIITDLTGKLNEL